MFQNLFQRTDSGCHIYSNRRAHSFTRRSRHYIVQEGFPRLQHEWPVDQWTDVEPTQDLIPWPVVSTEIPVLLYTTRSSIKIIYENNKSNETRKKNTFKTTTVKLDPREVTFLTLQLNITNRLNNALCAGHFALPKMVFDYIMAASWLK